MDDFGDKFLSVFIYTLIGTVMMFLIGAVVGTVIYVLYYLIIHPDQWYFTGIIPFLVVGYLIGRFMVERTQ
jgi:hypothetical protein